MLRPQAWSPSQPFFVSSRNAPPHKEERCVTILKTAARETTASPTLFKFAVLLISFCLMPLAPTRKLQNRNEFAPGKPNKRNRLFPLGCFESNMLWNAKYFRARRLGTFIPGSWRIAARITSLQYFLFALNKFSEERYPCLPRYPAQV